jgi:hypothetical protein
MMTRLLRSGRILALATVLVLGACGSTAVPLATNESSSAIAASASPAASLTPASTATARPTSSPTPSFDRITGWRADIDALLAARESIHPDPWHGMTRADWVAAADAVKARISELTDDQVLVELIRLAAMPGWTGRDGHTGIFLTPGSGIHAYPIRWWRFSDGLVITTARAPYQDLVGSRVSAIDGHPIADVLRLVEPLAPRDNPSNLLAYGPLYLRVSELLAGIGVIDSPGPATFSLVDQMGATRDVTIEPITVEDDVAWNSGQPHRLPPTAAPWLRDQAKPLWWTYLPDTRTLFVQYNSVEAGVDSIADEILARAKRDDVTRVVVDLRHNGGGDNTTMGHLEDVVNDPAINRPGRLFVLFGRITFSAAANFATDLEQSSAATFAGEAMGGSPNLYGDARQVELPYAAQSVYIASRYWQRSAADDQRITIEPDIAAALSSADYFAGRDPVLQAVFDTPVAPG